MPSRSTPAGPGRSAAGPGRSAGAWPVSRGLAGQPGPGRSAGPVGAADAGVHGLAQMAAQRFVRLGDPDQGPADGLAHRDPGAFTLIGEGPDAPAESGCAGELGDEPVSFGPGGGAAGPAAARRLQPVELGVQAPQAVPVLADRRLVKDRLRTETPSPADLSAASPAARSAAGISWRGLAISTARWAMPMLSSTRTLRSCQVRRHFRPTRRHCCAPAPGWPRRPRPAGRAVRCRDRPGAARGGRPGMDRDAQRGRLAGRRASSARARLGVPRLPAQR